jgi:hypothetical protein
MTIRHVVMWRLATTDDAERVERAATIKAKLESLPPLVPQLQRLEVGVNTLPSGDFDVVLISDFADEEALQGYQEHPEHESVAAYIRSVVGGRAAVDFVV